MSLVSLAKKAKYGQEIESLDAGIWSHIYEMAKVFNRFEAIEDEIQAIADFTEEDRNEILTYMNDCYRRLMYASLGAHNIEGVGGVPIEIWDEVGIDIRPILASVGKYTYPDSTSEIVVDSTSSE
jgi:hypothetical protein